MTTTREVEKVSRALDQVAELLEGLLPAQLTQGTPCDDWTVRELVDHLVATPTRFASMLRGEQIDWSAPSPPAGDNPAGAFREHANDLVTAWQEHDRAATTSGVDWQCAELAVHTWDLASALGVPTSGLDPEVAERGLAFMRASLTDDRRAPAFGPERQAPADADVYQRIAAFAGRRV
ncbi:MAG: TIGR03086 family metal-binding protein [Dermatophilaceae bacterium]